MLPNSFYQDLIKLIESVIDIMESVRSQLNDSLGTYLEMIKSIKTGRNLNPDKISKKKKLVKNKSELCIRMV